VLHAVGYSVTYFVFLIFPDNNKHRSSGILRQEEKNIIIAGFAWWLATRCKVSIELQDEADVNICLSSFYRMSQKHCAFARRHKQHVVQTTEHTNPCAR
jgi:hypothetical protein